MFSSSRLIRIVVLAVLTIGVASLASAQVVNSGAQAITLNATLAETLTLSLSANAVNFTLAAGSPTNAGSTGVTATTTWVLKPGRTNLTVDAYFASAAAALTDGAGNNIPSSAFQINNNGTGAAPLVNTLASGFGGALAGLRLRTLPITGANKNASATDVMTFNIDLSSLAMQQLPAATYTGTLNIQAQATP